MFSFFFFFLLDKVVTLLNTLQEGFRQSLESCGGWRIETIQQIQSFSQLWTITVLNSLDLLLMKQRLLSVNSNCFSSSFLSFLFFPPSNFEERGEAIPMFGCGGLQQLFSPTIPVLRYKRFKNKGNHNFRRASRSCSRSDRSSRSRNSSRSGCSSGLSNCCYYDSDDDYIDSNCKPENTTKVKNKNTETFSNIKSSNLTSRISSSDDFDRKQNLVTNNNNDDVNDDYENKTVSSASVKPNKSKSKYYYHHPNASSSSSSSVKTNIKQNLSLNNKALADIMLDYLTCLLSQIKKYVESSSAVIINNNRNKKSISNKTASSDLMTPKSSPSSSKIKHSKNFPPIHQKFSLFKKRAKEQKRRTNYNNNCFSCCRRGKNYHEPQQKKRVVQKQQPNIRRLSIINHADSSRSSHVLQSDLMNLSSSKKNAEENNKATRSQQQINCSCCYGYNQTESNWRGKTYLYSDSYLMFFILLILRLLWINEGLFCISNPLASPAGSSFADFFYNLDCCCCDCEEEESDYESVNCIIESNRLKILLLGYFYLVSYRILKSDVIIKYSLHFINEIVCLISCCPSLTSKSNNSLINVQQNHQMFPLHFENNKRRRTTLLKVR